MDPILGVTAAIEWSNLLTGIKTGFEDGITDILPIAGVMLLAAILFGVYKKYTKKAAS
jgi:hypothetical protein